MISIEITQEISACCPDLALGCLRLQLRVAPSSEVLRAQIAQTVFDIRKRLTIEDIHGITPIGATRAAYRACGKEPSRYRPSAEALLRRVVSGKALYEINNAVDLLNWISIRSGFSIGGFDAGLIEGPVSLGIGRPDEPYEAIARGPLNIEFLPVLRDAHGAFGTPTSDSVRTGVTDATTDFLMVFYDFANSSGLEALLTETADLYAMYCSACDIEMRLLQ